MDDATEPNAHFKKPSEVTKSNTEPNEDILEQINSFAKLFQLCTNTEPQNFATFERFTKWLHRPVDASTLGVFRMFYGFAMLIDVAEERGGGNLDLRYGEPLDCDFPLFNGIRAFSFPIMGCIYLCMWLGAIGITLGYRFRCSCLAFLVPYWYLFLLNKSTWNNHTYLFGLVGTMLTFTQANRYCSLDKYFNPSMPSTVPYWNYFLIKFQFFILYMYAGLKKLTAEWLSGYAMSSLSRHWVLSPFRWFLTEEMTDLLIVHWFTAIFDLIIAFLMTAKKTRMYATPFMISFHLINSRLFVIGMFPWVCLAQVPMFFNFDWPRKVTIENLNKLYNNAMHVSTCNAQLSNKNMHRKKLVHQTEAVKESAEKEDLRSYCKGCRKLITNTNKSSNKEFFQTIIILLYCGLQLFLPYSHFLTKGYNNWTNGLYGYSWDMMVHSYFTVLTTIKIVDNSNNQTNYLDPYAFTGYDRWTRSADMAYQYAHCIRDNIEIEYKRDPSHSPLNSTNISIYIDSWCSMNGRFQQRVYDPRVDLLKAEWSPIKKTEWALPLLNEFNYMRPKLRSITDDVLAWNNYSDVLFVADFPGLTLTTFMTHDLTNISLTILEGKVHYKSDNELDSSTLTVGNSINIPSGVTHHITTMGVKPSSYLYTFANMTTQQNNITTDDEFNTVQRAKLPLLKEFLSRVENYKKFLQHMGNSVLYLLYGVPIPIKVREKS